MASTIDPRFMEVVNWANLTGFQIAQYSVIPVLTDPAAWKSWARYVATIPTIAALNVPDPDQFDDWQAWAFRFNYKLELLPIA